MKKKHKYLYDIKSCTIRLDSVTVDYLKWIAMIIRDITILNSISLSFYVYIT